MSNFIKSHNSFYLRNVAEIWRSELNTDKKIYILSPYITKIAEGLLENIENVAGCEIYTTFNLENFLHGSSSIETLKNLIGKGIEVYSVPKLHAKIILVSETFVSIGSQNLTDNGTRNKEATFTSKDLEIVNYVEGEIKNWINERSLISLEMLEDLENLIEPLETKYKEIKDELEKVEGIIEEREQERVLEQQKELERLKERKRQRQYQQKLRILAKNLQEFDKTHEVVRGSVKVIESETSSVNTFFPRSIKDMDLLNWRTGNDRITLKDTYRYLALIENTGKLAWSRIKKTRITKYENNIAWNDKIELNNKKYTIILTANWNKETLADYNVEINLKTVKISYNFQNKLKISEKTIGEYKINCWFNFENITIRNIESLVNDDDLSEWIKNNMEEFNEIIMNRLLQSFKYTKNLTGSEANSFLETGKSYDLRVRRIKNQKFLSFKQV